jgi:hypothetical protein
VAVNEDRRSLGRLDGVCLDIVDSVTQRISVAEFQSAACGAIEQKGSYVCCVFWAVRLVRGAGCIVEWRAARKNIIWTTIEEFVSVSVGDSAIEARGAMD